MQDRAAALLAPQRLRATLRSGWKFERKLEKANSICGICSPAIPAAIYTTDGEGRITYFNQAVVELAGRTPKIGSDAWCVTWKLFSPDGTPLPHDLCPMAFASGKVGQFETRRPSPNGRMARACPFSLPTPAATHSETSLGRSTCWSTSASEVRRKPAEAIARRAQSPHQE